jgi:hypothetical protein
MGRWLEVLSERPPADADGYAQRCPLIVAEITPHPLLGAGRCLPRAFRDRFPMLDLVREDSSAYVDEWLWLDAPQVEVLLGELRRVRRLCRREEFLAGMNARRFYDFWRQDESPEKCEAWLDRIERVLDAEGGRWVLVSL